MTHPDIVLSVASGVLRVVAPGGNDGAAANLSTLRFALRTAGDAKGESREVLALPRSSAEDTWGSVGPRVHHWLEQGGIVEIERGSDPKDAVTHAARVLRERGQSLDGLASAGGDVPPPSPGPTPRAVRLRAMLAAGALGDAMGAEIEFLDLASLRRRHPDGIRHLPAHRGTIGAITDDTQMTLFTAEGLIRSAVRQAQRGICHPASIIHHAYLRWLVTQGVAPRIAIDADEIGLFRDPRLQARRAPGRTCLSALATARSFGMAARNDSKGCGGVMRLAPMVLLPGRAVEVSGLTHGHPVAALAAQVWIELLSAAWNGTDLRAAAERLATDQDNPATRAIAAALALPGDRQPETVERLGGGWVAEEAVAIALYAALHARDLDEGLQTALLHSGDSDSTAAMAGNLLGLLFPDQVFTHPLQAMVECTDLIDRLARDLDAAFTAEGVADPALFRRYPGV